MQVVVVDVKENLATTKKWAARSKFTFPVAMDRDGKIAESYAPPGAAPDLKRDQVAIASNLVIDREGKIQYYSLLDSQHFDAKLVDLIQVLEGLLKH